MMMRYWWLFALAMVLCILSSVGAAPQEPVMEPVTAEGGGLVWLAYWLWPPLIFFALWWLVRGGRSGLETARRPLYPRAVFLTALAFSVAIFGFALGGSPNPMEGFVTVFKGAVGLDGEMVTTLLILLYFSLLAVVGTKLICGWGCPFGALQELLYEIPLFRRIKANQLPFLLTMPVRSLTFLVFLLVIFTGRERVALYDFVDPFNLFAFDIVLWTVGASIGLLLVLSLFVYRPFCQLVCPFGWYSWFLERIALFGIRVNRRTCSRCNACANACPLEAARGRVEGSPIPADCFSCARCLRVCPAGALDYGARWRKPEGKAS